jgi:pyruvate dehydrogenase E1 component alpha subunit
MGAAADRARKGQGPTFVSANTYRFRGHSMSDPLKYRSREEAEAARLRDPITLYEKRLRDAKLIDEEWIEQTETEVKQIVDEAVKFADESPHPPREDMYTDILSENYPLQK